MNLNSNLKTFTENTEAFEQLLKGLHEHNLSVAILGRDSANRPAAVAAAVRCGAKVILLDDAETDLKKLVAEGMDDLKAAARDAEDPHDTGIHVYKRRLNAAGSDCLLYSAACSDIAYNIYNAGTTFVQNYICMDNFDINPF